jgi:hypothetical protein
MEISFSVVFPRKTLQNKESKESVVATARRAEVFTHLRKNYFSTWVWKTLTDMPGLLSTE